MGMIVITGETMGVVRERTVPRETWALSASFFGFYFFSLVVFTLLNQFMLMLCIFQTQTNVFVCVLMLSPFTNTSGIAFNRLW